MVRANKDKVVLFIEGSGDLRKGFRLLLQKAGLRGMMPKIVMGDNKNTTIEKFKNTHYGTMKILLVDLDAPPEKRDEDLRNNNLTDASDHCFFMIQEMEAWFLSQPEVIERFYSIEGFTDHSDPQGISNPSHVLKNEVKQKTRAAGITQRDKRTYKKVDHGIKLLSALDASNLREVFSDFDNLIKKASLEEQIL